MSGKKRPYPPHPNAEFHARFMRWLEEASPEEKRESLVRAGIITPKGRLRKPYRTDPVLSYREPLPAEDE